MGCSPANTNCSFRPTSRAAATLRSALCLLCWKKNKRGRWIVGRRGANSMIRPKRILIVGSSILSFRVLMPTAGHSGAQEQTNRPAQDGKVLETSVPEFEVRDQTLLEALWKLARGSSPFGFGFEEVLKNKLLDPDIPDPRFSLRLQGKSVREILDALCLSDPRYIWSIDGATIDVFPKDVVDDRSNFLNRQLERLELSNARDVNDGLFAISRQLPPPFEQI